MPNRLESYLKASEGDLPTMPAIANRVVQAIQNPDSSIDDIRILIEQDSAIAARSPRCIIAAAERRSSAIVKPVDETLQQCARHRRALLRA